MKNSWMNIAGMIGIAFALDWIGKLCPETVFGLFAHPAAFLASLFFGAHPILIAPGDLLIPLTHPIHVVPACSAFSFFCLLCGLMAVHAFRLPNRSKAVFYSILALPAAYILTIVINSLRIISAYYANEAARVLLPANFQAAMHQGVGIVVFLTALMAVSLVLERRFSYEDPSQ